MNKIGMDKLQPENLKHFPNVNSLMKISLGLILFTIISTAFVYAETISVDVDGTSYDVEYTTTGMTVSGIEADTELISIILFVEVTDSPGTLDITFERSFFDSVYQGADEEFFVLADSDEPNFTETQTTAQSRTLSIELPSGTEDVEIIGSVFGQSVEETPVEEPVEETPVEEPVEETPVEEPVEETPVEEPVEETPVEEKPVVETPKIQCGSGTILKDGACVLDERCGSGTILKDGECVLDTTKQTSTGSTISKGISKELITGVVVAFVIAGIVGIILGIMSKASKSHN